jgi:hypothetical protein
VSNVGCEVYEIVSVSLCHVMLLKVAKLGCICWGFQFAYCNYGLGETEGSLCLPCENVVWQKKIWVKEYSSPLM